MIIYKITNSANGKIYIGQTKKHINLRLREHINDSKRFNYKLSNAIIKYGSSNFSIEKIIEGDFNRFLTDELECHYIRLYNSTKHYNIKLGGNYTKMTQETKDKISKANKGNKNPKPKNYTFIDRYGNDKAEIIKQKMSIKLGLSNNGRAKKVKDLVTGEIYGCAKEAALKYGINPWQLRTCLRGARKNKYNLVYIW